MKYFELVNLRIEPFATSPNPDLFYPSRQHMRCVHMLIHSIYSRCGINLVIGDIGTGKTTLSRIIMRELARIENTAVHLVLDPTYTALGDFLTVLCSMFKLGEGKQLDDEDKKSLITEYLRGELDAGRFVVLIIDEGQKLPEFMLDFFSEMREVQASGMAALQVVIFAQTDFQAQLDTHLAFTKRLAVCYQLEPLDFQGVKKMIEFRLQEAGKTPGAQSLFTAPAIWAIYNASKGYPRKVVSICHRMLMKMIIAEKKRVTFWFVRNALKAERGSKLKAKLGFKRMFAILALACLGLVGVVLARDEVLLANLKNLTQNGLAGLEFKMPEMPNFDFKLPEMPKLSALFGGSKSEDQAKPADTQIPEPSAPDSFAEKSPLPANKPEPAPATPEKTEPAPAAVEKPAPNPAPAPASPPAPAQALTTGPGSASNPENTPSPLKQPAKPEPAQPAAAPPSESAKSVAEPAKPAPAEDAQDAKRSPASLGSLPMPQRNTVANLIRSVYGVYNPKLLELLAEANPQIHNLSQVPPGTNITFPAVVFRQTALPSTGNLVLFGDAKNLADAGHILFALNDKGLAARIMTVWNEQDGLNFYVVRKYYLPNENALRDELNMLKKDFNVQATAMSKPKPGSLLYGQGFLDKASHLKTHGSDERPGLR